MRLIIILLCCIYTQFLISQTYTNNSVLSEGQMYKIEVKETGIYKITGNQLSDAGIDLSTINGSNLQLFGNGGKPLEELIASERYDDLVENAIKVSTDGSFGTSDYILFYGQGPDTYDVFSNQKLLFKKNIYSESNYYFLKLNGQNGKRIQVESGSQSSEYESDTYIEHIRHEVDQNNLLGQFGSTEGTGQTWYGESLSNDTQISLSEFVFHELIPNEVVTMTASLVARDNISSSFTISAGGSNFTKFVSSVSTGNVEAVYASTANFTESFIPSAQNLDLSINYNKNSSSAQAWLDYVEVEGRVRNQYPGSSYIFYDPLSIEASTSSYSIQSAVNLEVWDVTRHDDLFQLDTRLSGNQVGFTSNNDLQLKKYIAFNPDTDPLSVTDIETVENQNLHGLKSAEYVIVYHDEFVEAAEKLLAHRLNVRPMNTVLVNIDHIYNEFSSGKCDPTALRDFVRFLDKMIPEFNYLLLLGDGSYDYRNIVPDLPDQNFVPVYETKQSLDPIRGFPSDDYFGLISDNEGLTTLKGALDIALGRLPARNAEEANDMIDKIIHYETSSSTLGDWRLNLAFAADDEDSNTHLNQADDIAEKVLEAQGTYNQEKIYFDSFVQESTPGGARYPDASKKINDGIFSGRLILNYLGHGGPKGWAQERVLKVSDINSWDNPDKLPVIITATCSFTGYDDPAVETAGEVAIRRKESGAVALFTTTRAVYASSNKRLTEAVFDTILTRENGEYLRIGEIMRRAKNSNFQDTSTINSRKFALIGDPTMTLAAPKHNISLDKINDKLPSEISQDTFGSLDQIVLEGHIEDFSGNELPDFNGTIFVTLFDKTKQVSTLKNDSGSLLTDFNVQENVLFKGSATVENGQFTISFFIPKDINFKYGNGKISMYAHDNVERDAAGFFDQINIGGSGNIDVTDNQPPLIQLYINDRTFVNGGYTHDEPVLIADLSDDLGINISGTSIGHDISATLNGDNSSLFILNDFYQSEANNSSKGTVRFPLGQLAPGKHQITVNAWDISNNSAEASIEFIIADGELGKLENVFAYPNPFSEHVNFSFQHDLDENELNLQINIYDLYGKLVKTLTNDTFAARYSANTANWDFRTNFGSNLPNGIYLFDVILRSTDGKINLKSDFQRLIKID